MFRITAQIARQAATTEAARTDLDREVDLLFQKIHHLATGSGALSMHYTRLGFDRVPYLQHGPDGESTPILNEEQRGTISALQEHGFKCQIIKDNLAGISCTSLKISW